MPKAGKYHIARKIADGGMAEIFLGTQQGMEGFERPVVLKRILAPLVADPQFRNMLIDEAHVAMGLNHSNIVQVLDLGRVRDRYFLVMELVDGWDLSQILERADKAHFPLPPELVLYIAAEICRALAYAHARTRDGQPLGIVHRDVSPQNVLVSEQGEVKLTDFGIAKAMGRREHTSQGVIKGKLAFMSPEQASGAVLDSRSDLFSLGTLLYQFLTRQRPFDAPTDLEAIMRVRACKFTPPEKVNPALGAPLVKLLHRAMQASPADRYPSADEMLLDIESVQRTAYKPAGQTELKRWLAELQQCDHCPTISHATVPTPAESEAFDIGEGAEVVFDDSNGELNPLAGEAIPQGLQPTIAASPEEMATALPRREEKTKAESPIALTESRIPSRIIVLALIVAALALGASLAIRGDSGILAKHGQGASIKRIADADKPEVKPPVVIDAGAKADSAAMAPPATATASVGENEEEEENLLKHAEPDDGKRVIGDDEGTRGAGVTAKARAAPVSVHVASTPTGAVVRLGKRVFGRAPMNLHFRPGITFELTFVKRGYLPATKRFTPTGQKNQTVRAVLKKKAPAPKKSILDRIFGKK